MEQNNIQNIRSNFKLRLKEIRISNEMTQEKFAATLGVKRSTYGNWENENSKIEPCIEDIKLICDKCNVSANHLILGSEIKNDTYSIAKKLTMSPDCIHKIQDDKALSGLLEGLVLSDEIDEIISKLKDIQLYQKINEANITCFGTGTMIKVHDAYKYTMREYCIVDLNIKTFTEGVKTYIRWDKSKYTFDEFVKMTLTKEGLMCLQNAVENFDKLSESDKYEVLREFIAKMTFDYCRNAAIAEMYKTQIAQLINQSVMNLIK